MYIELARMAAYNLIAKDWDLCIVVTAVEYYGQLVLVGIVLGSNLETAEVNHDRFGLQSELSLIGESQTALYNNGFQFRCRLIHHEHHAWWGIDCVSVDGWKVTTPSICIAPGVCVAKVTAVYYSRSTLHPHVEGSSGSDGKLRAHQTNDTRSTHKQRHTLYIVDIDCNIRENRSKVGANYSEVESSLR
jgi:hypothetical protein